jgi:hypothetical protein
MASKRSVLSVFLWVLLVGAANAQLSEPDQPIKGEAQPGGLRSNRATDVTMPPRRGGAVELSQRGLQERDIIATDEQRKGRSDGQVQNLHRL